MHITAGVKKKKLKICEGCKENGRRHIFVKIDKKNSIIKKT